MFIKKQKIELKFLYLLVIFLVSFFYLLLKIPGFKGDLEQSIRIKLKQPVLLKSKAISENQIIDYSKKIFFGLENRILNHKKFEVIKIDIKFSELEKLKAVRKNALKLKKLSEIKKVKTNITFKGKKYKAKARLKGDMTTHYGNVKQWSLKIELEDGKSIFGMNDFSLTIFSQRDFPYNFVASELIKTYKLLTPRYKTVNVIFNGEDWGLMLLEEQFSETFFADNRIKEAPIFRMTNENDFEIMMLGKAIKGINNLDHIMRWQGLLETKIYDKKKILSKSNIPNKNTNETLATIFKNIQELNVLKKSEASKYLIDHVNLESFAKATAITAFFGDGHSQTNRNSRYYLDPYTLKLEPILTDLLHSDLAFPIDGFFLNNYNFLYRNTFELKEFQKIYLETLEDIKKNFFKIEKNFDLICKDFGKNCKNQVDINLLKNNLDYLLNQKQKVFNINSNSKNKNNKIIYLNTNNEFNLNKKKIHFRAFDDGNLFLYNLTSEIITITKLIFKEKEKCINNCKKKEIYNTIILQPSNYQNFFKKISKLNFIDKSMKYLEIVYKDEKNNLYQFSEMIEKNHLKITSLSKLNSSKNETRFLKQDKNYIIKTGEYLINNPIVIPSGYNLVIEKGTTLKMNNKSHIFVANGLVRFLGELNEPINIVGSDINTKWNGIYINSKSKGNLFSNLQYVNIKNISYFDNQRIQLTGGLNFINSNIKLTNFNIENSFSEDAINIVNSNFIIDSINLINAKSDGIDVDFGKGEITESTFKNIDGDAIDLSGSSVSLKNITIHSVKDKAISVGEDSNLEVRDVKISSSAIGIASKDSSNVFGKNIKLEKCRLHDFAVFQKKSYFSGASINLKNVSDCSMHLIQKGSKLILDGKNFKGKKIDAKELYY